MADRRGRPAVLHAAEGHLYRSVLARASEACAIPAGFVPAQELAARVARATGLPEERIASILAALGKASGKPWTKDEKEATLAAWLALAGGAEMMITPRPRARARASRRGTS
jgi:hypothetical protein